MVYGLNGDFQEVLCQEAPSRTAAANVHPHNKPPPTHISTGDPPTLADSFGSASCMITDPFPSVLVGRFCLCPPRLDSVPPSPMEVLKLNPTGLQSHIPWGFPVTLLDLQTGKPDMRLRTFTTVGEFLWYYCSPDCGSLTW